MKARTSVSLPAIMRSLIKREFIYLVAAGIVKETNSKRGFTRGCVRVDKFADS